MDKNVYTIEEVDELKLGRAGRISGRDATGQGCLYTRCQRNRAPVNHAGYVCHENPRLQGCLRLLERIKARVEEEKRS